MAKPYDTRLIAMVAQEWFETPDLNQFCKLIPIVYIDGTKATALEFPNDGEVWWMLTSQTAHFAEPGRLLSASIEDSREYFESDPAKSRYQVRRDSIRDVDAKEGCEVIDIPSADMSSIEDLVGGFRMGLAVAPTPTVMLQWRSNVYGPFSASVDPHGGSGTTPRYAFAPASTTDMTVFQIAKADFDAATKGHRIAVADDVSFTQHRRGDSYQLAKVTHDLLLADGVGRAVGANATRLVLEPIDRKLIRYAKQCLTRKKRQTLAGLLNELELTGREVEEAEDLSETIRRVRAITEKQDSALDTVAKALLEAGLLGDDRIANAEKAFAERYIQERTAEIQANIAEQLEQRRSELQSVERQLKDVKATLAKEEAQRRKEFKEQLAADRAAAESQIRADQEALTQRKAELERQEQALQQNLQAVTTDLREAGDDVVNRFLTIAPLLGSFGLGQQADRGIRSPESPSHTPSAVPIFQLPAYVTGSRLREGSPTEEEFFDRFRSVVEDSGFTYRPLDLQRFHISVKCGDLTVLGGPSGTGKSSLPVLYAQALLGDEAADGRLGCLMVNVNPSWMDTRDLVGHLNTIEGRFYPAESGLFQHLVCAHEEYVASKESSGVYLACLDEMNLSQVEHYFSDFMMALERKGDNRSIQCFSPGGAGENCPFREWSTVPLSTALRFVGTVNFDETTRLLSDRFLDRVNLIQLGASALPGVTEGDVVVASASGPMVTLGDMMSWRADHALPAEMAGVLDQIRPPLTQIGCPLSPRVYRAICRFVGSARELLDESRAFDVQLAQRVVPKIRSLITGRQVDALDALIQILEQSTLCAFDESLPLLEQIRHTAGSRAWDLDE